MAHCGPNLLEPQLDRLHGIITRSLDNVVMKPLRKKRQQGLQDNFNKTIDAIVGITYK